MNSLYALYDRNGNFIDCGFDIKEIKKKKSFLSKYEKKEKQMKIYRIPTDIQDDVFQDEDKLFVLEEQSNIFTDSERAKILGVSRKTLYRHKKHLVKRQKNYKYDIRIEDLPRCNYGKV